jgi:hypothetical protein
MTREEKLWSMTMVNLVSVAEKLGVKIDKKGAKEKAIKKIIAAEDAKNAKTDNLVPMPGAEKLAELKKEVSEDKCADGRTYAEIGKEIAKEAKEKAKKAKAEKKVSAKKSVEKKKEKKSKIDFAEKRAEVTEICKSINYSTKFYEKQTAKYIILMNADNKNVANLYIGSKRCTLLIKEASAPKGLTPDRVRNCAFNWAIDIEYSKMKSELVKLLPKIKYVRKNKEDK